MTASYNGFKAGDPGIFAPPGLDNSPIPGTDIRLEPGLHKGSIATVLFYVAEQLNKRVAPAADQAEGYWGYAFRPSKNDPDLISCHASGTAFDYAASLHPNGKSGTWTKKQLTEIHKILAEVGNLVHFGGDGWGEGSTIDPMHFEIAEGVTMMQLDAMAEKLTAQPPAPKPEPAPSPPSPKPSGLPLQYGQRTPAVLHFQQDMVHTFPAYNHYGPTGYFGDQTLAGVKEFQFRVGLVVDGIVGPKTAAQLARFGIRVPR